MINFKKVKEIKNVKLFPLDFEDVFLQEYYKKGNNIIKFHSRKLENKIIKNNINFSSIISCNNRDFYGVGAMDNYLYILSGEKFKAFKNFSFLPVSYTHLTLPTTSRV